MESKQNYAAMLMNRIQYMREENTKARLEYSYILDDLRRWQEQNPKEPTWKFIDKLDKNQKRIYRCSGVVYSDSAFKRLRIELNTILLEIENNI